jgi:hypothetical protein
MKSRYLWCICLIMAAWFSGSAWAGPVQWNNHWYLPVYTPRGVTWDEAKIHAAAQGGYLATATSIAENGVIFALINDPKYWYNDAANNSLGPWLGGYYVGAAGTMNPDDWAWVSGEAWGFRNWASGEPNFPEERALQFFGNGLNNRQPTWNNLSADNPNPKGFVIKWNSQPPALTQWTGVGANDHWYLAVYAPGGLSWDAARAAAALRGGYLATVTSAEENNFIFSLVNDWKFWYNDAANNSLGPWLGGYYAGTPGSMNPDDWALVSGEVWGYRNWAAGEPNFATETVLQFFGNGLNNMQPTWNNLSRSETHPKGYVIEWDSLPTRWYGNIAPFVTLLLE